MEKTMIKKIALHELVRGDAAISTEDGAQLYERIVSALERNHEIEIDFDGINLIVTSFLNASFGKLIKSWERSTLDQKIHFANLKNEDKELIELVLVQAEKYFKKLKV